MSTKFVDGVKTVDYVLVYNVNQSYDSKIKVQNFIANLANEGFDFETSVFSAKKNINFVKIHAPISVLIHYSEVFLIELACKDLEYKPRPRVLLKCMGTELTMPSVTSPICQRAPESISGVIPTGITNAEKTLIMYRVLAQTRFGDDKFDIGIENLLTEKVFDAAFPLHDGPYEWTTAGPLNDRQLLAKYWSPLRCWFKQQPLDLIQKYYGPETGFYFAWLGYYNKMLIPAAILGVLCFILGINLFRGDYEAKTQDVCGSDHIVCPRCRVPECKYELLRSSCLLTHLIYYFDNPITVAFAAMMSIWATLFMEFWKRQERLLQIRWNLLNLMEETTCRPEFEQGTSYRRSSAMGESEPYVPSSLRVGRIIITFSTVILLVFLMLLAILSVMIYSKVISVVIIRHSTNEFIVDNVILVASITAATISVIIMFIFEMIYSSIAIWLTKLENPRTQIDFDNSYIYKYYAMAFVNNYSVVFYIAFLKGKLFTHPGDTGKYTTLGGLQSDLCDASGCMINLGVQLLIIMVAKSFVSIVHQKLIPLIMIIFNEYSSRNRKKHDTSLEWECDYMLNVPSKYRLMNEYMQMIIQYGFVTFFVAGFPLAPLLALINNLFELRIDASKMVKTFRRPVPFKIASLGAWNAIMQAVTYIGIATNAFVMAFTSEFVEREIYRYHSDATLNGFVNSTLSAYNTSEFTFKFKGGENKTVCYYPGSRYPPGTKKQYEVIDEVYWYNFAIKMFAVVAFEHVVMLITGVIAYAIPDIPFSVEERISYQKRQFREMRMKSLTESYMKTQKAEAGTTTRFWRS